MEVTRSSCLHYVLLLLSLASHRLKGSYPQVGVKTPILVPRPKEEEEEEKGPGFSRSHMRLIIYLTTC